MENGLFDPKTGRLSSAWLHAFQKAERLNNAETAFLLGCSLTTLARFRASYGIPLHYAVLLYGLCAVRASGAYDEDLKAASLSQYYLPNTWQALSVGAVRNILSEHRRGPTTAAAVGAWCDEKKPSVMDYHER